MTDPINGPLRGTAGGGAYLLEGTESVPLRCARTGADYIVHVAVPEAPAPAGGWPVLYLLDATGSFGTCVEAMRRMSRRPDATGVCPMVIAGISAATGYDTGRRQRDYTTPRAGDENSGGAATFLAFLDDQVKPLVAGRAAVDGQRQTLCGHSLAGFFTLWVLANHPASFAAYAAISPSIWWDRDALLHDAGGAAMGSRRAFITVGEWEGDLPPWQKLAPDAASVRVRRQARNMVAGAQDAAAHFARLLGEGQLRFRLMGEEDHASILSAAIPHALRLASNTA